MSQVLFLFVYCRMQWTDEHHTVLLREILAAELFKYKPRTQQRSNLWNSIVDHLNDAKNPGFSVTQRAVKDKFNLLKDKFIAKKKEQDKASGIDVEVTEIDVLLEEIIDKEKYYELECKDKDEEQERKIEKSKATAAGMRQKAMESLGESLKRNRSDSEDSVSEERHKTKKRSKCSEAIEYLQAKSEQELDLKRKQPEIDEKKKSLAERQHQDFMLLMQNMQASTMKLIESVVKQINKK